MILRLVADAQPQINELLKRLEKSYKDFQTARLAELRLRTADIFVRAAFKPTSQGGSFISFFKPDALSEFQAELFQSLESSYRKSLQEHTADWLHQTHLKFSAFLLERATVIEQQTLGWYSYLQQHDPLTVRTHKSLMLAQTRLDNFIQAARVPHSLALAGTAAASLAAGGTIGAMLFLLGFVSLPLISLSVSTVALLSFSATALVSLSLIHI